MAAGDASLAWAYLSRSPDYRTAWAASAQAQAYEAGPISLRIQSANDLGAARFALLAWEDPDRPDDVVSPFWAEAPMLDGELVQGARPLLPLLASSGARIEGLRLGSGGLVLKVQRGDKAAQVRIGAGGPFPADAGLVVRLDYAHPLPVLIERVRDLWNVTHGPVPRRGRVRGEDIRNC